MTSDYITTREAAEYCRYSHPGVLRTAASRGLMKPYGRRGKLLFPGRDGGPRSPSCLDKPFAEVSRAIGLPFELTPRGMRRTFQDLARAAGVHDVVTRSISGHATQTMQVHYSTASADEQRESLGRILGKVSLTRS